MTNDLPDEDEKAKLDRFLEDFKSVKEQDEATAKEAASMVADLFEKLDTEAMKDVPDVGGEETETVEETKTEESQTEGLSDGETEETAEETVEETVAPEEEAKDADPNPEYTLEEIYQFCKKRREEDEAAAAEDAACAEDSAEEVEEEKEEDEEEEVTTDHAPRIPVTMNGTPAAKGSLADMYNTLKEGGR
jgi:hypothetical protein